VVSKFCEKEIKEVFDYRRNKNTPVSSIAQKLKNCVTYFEKNW